LERSSDTGDAEKQRPAGIEPADRGGSRFVRLLEALFRGKAIIAISTFVIAGVVLLASLGQDPVYKAAATVRVDAGDRPVSPAAVIELADTDEVAVETGAQLGGVDADPVSDAIVAESSDAPGLFTIEATADHPDFAARLATTFAEQYVAYTDRLGDAFKGTAEVVEKADAPESPVSPKTTRNTLVGAAAGFLLGLVIALAREGLDRRVRSARELAGVLGVPLLGRIPHSPALALDETLRRLPAADAESFQMARVAMRYLDLDGEITSVLLTSAEAGDGKTTVTFGLAAAAATSGDRVLVIEADMRQPSLANVAEPVPSGLSGVLAGKAALGEALTSVEVEAGAEGVSGSVDVLLAGPAPANPTQLIESQKMAQLLYDAERDYDLVVIDTPPATILPDAIPLMSHVDAVVVVVGLGHDKREDLEDLRARLAQVDAPTIGVIANFADMFDESYYRYIRAHEAAVAEAGTVPLRPPARPAPLSESAAEPAASEWPAEPAVSEGPASEVPVDLNVVTYEELRGFDLTGTQAKRLIAYRERRGGFSSVSDIDDVPGFPDHVREDLKRRVKV